MLDYSDLQSASTEFKEKETYIKRVLNDFWICLVSREASLLGRKEVLTGKAKFGILGDGKEVPQVALAHFFERGDFRSGYYRDQTLLMAQGQCTVEEYFAQMYADADNDPFSGGRQMNSHYATPLIDKEDNWLKHSERYNSSADISSTGGQMARALGLALASKKYREMPELDPQGRFSKDGREVVFCTIGDASTSEGIFWETLNAASVMRVPLIIIVWDDGYGISVPVELQTTKASISKASEGFLMDENGDGIHMYTVKGWDYSALINVYDRAVSRVRNDYVPALIHVQEVTQPQGHSTSGSHERYKSKDRLKWEMEADGIEKMAEWLVETDLASVELIEEMRTQAKAFVKEGSKKAWKRYTEPIQKSRKELLHLYNSIEQYPFVADLHNEMEQMHNPLLGEILQNARKLRIGFYNHGLETPDTLASFIQGLEDLGRFRYNTHLYSMSDRSALKIPVVHPEYSNDAKLVNGYQVMNAYFDRLFEKMPNTFAFGEDVGHIGDVNQGFAGLQEKYGVKRIFDTGIREWTIVGQAIGMAMRGLRPIGEIQYLDYLIYGLSALSDDLATVRYRSNGIQQAPAIIRTRGHRLEGIWHAGSPLGMMINSLRGIYICTPRNMVQAAGMYNTLIQSTDPGLVIEVLNGYRRKELLPDNIGEYTVPLGVPEILNEGDDITVVSYGANIHLIMEALEVLEPLGASVEVIDVQTLIPFDLEEVIANSLQKTNRLLVVDEDLPGGASAFILQQILEKQNGYYYLDAQPRTLTAGEHRTPFGSDGDFFTKPQVDTIAQAIIEALEE